MLRMSDEQDDEGITWFQHQQQFERDQPELAKSISKFRDWLMTDPGQTWLMDSLRLHRFRNQRRSLRAKLGELT